MVRPGVLIATSLLHLLTPAYESLGSPCLPEAWSEYVSFSTLAIISFLLRHVTCDPDVLIYLLNIHRGSTALRTSYRPPLDLHPLRRRALCSSVRCLSLSECPNCYTRLS